MVLGVVLLGFGVTSNVRTSAWVGVPPLALMSAPKSILITILSSCAASGELPPARLSNARTASILCLSLAFGLVAMPSKISGPLTMSC